MTRETQRKLIWPALLLVLACVQAVNAQDAQAPAQPSPTPLTAPPPFKMIVKEERTQIEQTQDLSKRLKLTITFAGAILPCVVIAGWDLVHIPDGLRIALESDLTFPSQNPFGNLALRRCLRQNGKAKP